MFGILKPTTGGDDIQLTCKELLLGRGKDCDIQLRFSDISGRHCRLVLSNGYWYIIDLKSTNGTKINGIKTTGFRADPGAKIKFARHEYTLVYEPTANGNDGTVPDDYYNGDVFSHSLLERAGIQNSFSERTFSNDDFKDLPNDQ